MDLKITATSILGQHGLHDVEFGYKVEEAGNGTVYLDWHDNQSTQYGQVSFNAETKEFIQVHFLG